MPRRTAKRIHEGTAYPTNYLIAVLDDRTAAERATDALQGAGISDTFSFHGEEGLASIKEHARRESLLHRAWVAVEDIASEAGEYHHEYLDHLRQGHSVVCVHASTKDEVERARVVLATHQAQAIRHFGRWAASDLSGTRATI